MTKLNSNATPNWTFPEVEVFYERGVRRAAEICGLVEPKTPHPDSNQSDKKGDTE